MTERELLAQLRRGVNVSTTQIALALRGSDSMLNRLDVDHDLFAVGAQPVSRDGDNYWSADDVRRYLRIPAPSTATAEPSDAA